MAISRPSQWLKAFLGTPDEITAIVGKGVYPVRIPRKVNLALTPALAYRRLKTEKGTTAAKGDGIVKAAYRIAAVSLDFDVADNLIDLVDSLIHGYQGSTDGFSVRRAEVSDQADDSEWLDDDSDSSAFVCHLDVVIAYVKAARKYTPG